MQLQLAGLTAVVTGAAGGIGQAASRALNAEGVRTVLLDREDSVRDADGERSIGIPVDVTDERALSAAIAKGAERFGGIDLVIGCAGISGPVGTALADTSAKDWRRVFEVNAAGSFLMLKAAYPWLRRSDAASVVLVASDSAIISAPGMAAYCASKAAVVQLARAAAVEWAADGIRVNALCPSIVDTAMSRGDLGADGGFDGAAFPVQTPAEVADQIVLLCSPRMRPVNAAAVMSDFGHSARSGFPA